MPTHNISPAPTGATATSSTPTRRLIASLVETRISVPSWVLLVELFIGLGWIRAAVEKVIDPSWWNGTVLSDFITSHTSLTLPWYRAFLDSAVEPYLLPISITVVLAQLFAGITLVAGRMVLTGLTVGMFLNLSFIAAGAVNPSIFYLVCQGALLLWIIQNAKESGVARRSFRWVPTVSFLVVLVNLPLVSTLDPAGVIEDPAMILVLFGLLMGVSSRVGASHGATTEYRAAPSDS